MNHFVTQKLGNPLSIPYLKREMRTHFENSWRVKEWKNQPSIERKRVQHQPNAEIIENGTFRQTIITSGWNPTEQRPRQIELAHHLSYHGISFRYGLWKKIAIWLGVCVSVFIIALIMSNFVRQLPYPWKASQVAEVEAHAVGDARQLTPSETYRIQLGRYQEEIGARYAWAAFQADIGESLEGLEPRFESILFEQGSFYRILAGTISDLREATYLCIRLKENDIPCSVVKL